jgi:NADPH-dependent curcumin reductase CurA
MTAYLLAGLLALVAVVPSLYRRWRDGRTIASLRVDVAQAAGQRDVAVATVEAAREVSADQAAGRVDADAVRAAGITAGVPVARIGRFIAGEGVVVRDASGAVITLPQGGWSHF